MVDKYNVKTPSDIEEMDSDTFKQLLKESKQAGVYCVRFFFFVSFFVFFFRQRVITNSNKQIKEVKLQRVTKHITYIHMYTYTNIHIHKGLMGDRPKYLQAVYFGEPLDSVKSPKTNKNKQFTKNDKERLQSATATFENEKRFVFTNFFNH